MLIKFVWHIHYTILRGKFQDINKIKTKKSRINRCGLILPDKLIYLFLKTASFIILANSS